MYNILSAHTIYSYTNAWLYNYFALVRSILKYWSILTVIICIGFKKSNESRTNFFHSYETLRDFININSQRVDIQRENLRRHILILETYRHFIFLSVFSPTYRALVSSNNLHKDMDFFSFHSSLAEIFINILSFYSFAFVINFLVLFLQLLILLFCISF